MTRWAASIGLVTHVVQQYPQYLNPKLHRLADLTDCNDCGDLIVQVVGKFLMLSLGVNS
jgi:hypothetical protein